ncbi:MAG: universal stress protein [Bacteroidetes bacterium]|nr:universal stress protein [Bacteroidota bacterium]
MKTILVPVDFSDNSKNALDYAIPLAKKLNMKIILLHAFHPSMMEALKDSLKVINHEDIIGTPADMKQLLNNWKEAVSKSEPGLKCESIFLESNLTDELNDLIDDYAIDFIIMGTKGATGLKSVFIGSNALKIIDTAICPVMAIPTDFKFKEYTTIAFASDYHDSDKFSVQFIAEIAKPFNASLEVVHIANEDIKPRFEEDLLSNFMSGIKKEVRYEKMNFHLIEGEEDINTALNEFVSKNAVELLAVSTVDRLLHGPLFNRGVATNLAHHIQVPLLVFHAFDDGDIDLFD